MAWTWISSAVDYIPIVGSAKNSVEAIAALCQGDYSTATAKGFEAIAGLAADLSTGGIGGTLGKVAVKGGCKDVAKYVGKKAGKAVAAKAVHIVENQIINEISSTREGNDVPSTETGENKKRSIRGEHVINNDVLKVFRKIVDEFLQVAMNENLRDLIARGRISQDMQVYQAINNPLMPADEFAISIEMVAHIPADRQYIDANAAMYGIKIRTLRQCLVEYMKAVYQAIRGSSDYRHVLPSIERSIRILVEEFIAGEYYVDNVALEYWLNEGDPRGRVAREQKYQDVKNKVGMMFRRLVYTGYNEEVIQWVHDLIRATQH